MFARSLRAVPLLLPLGAALGPALSLSLTRDDNRHVPTSDVQSHIGKGYQFVQEGKFQEAVSEFQAALDADPKLIRIRYQLGVSYFALQQWPEARREFERLRKETNADPGVL